MRLGRFCGRYEARRGAKEGRVLNLGYQTFADEAIGSSPSDGTSSY